MATTKTAFALECATEFGDFYTDTAVKTDYLLFVQEAINKAATLLKIPQLKEAVQIALNDSTLNYVLPEDFYDYNHIEKQRTSGGVIYLGPVHRATAKELIEFGFDYRQQLGSTNPATLFDELDYWYPSTIDPTTKVQRIGIWKRPGSGFPSNSDTLALNVHYFKDSVSLAETDTIPFSRGLLDILKIKVRALSQAHEDNLETSDGLNKQFIEEMLLWGTRKQNPEGRSMMRVSKVGGI